MKAAEFFLQWCDGKLTDEEFNEEGNAFLQYYYSEETDLYIRDYA
jgi:hypothetical protein